MAIRFPSKSKNLLTIIIPVKNESESIIKTLSEIKNKLKVAYQIIVVNDNSTDNTVAKIKNYQKKNPRIILVDNPNDRQGFSSALKTGFENAKTDYCLPVMADSCDDPITINAMYQLIPQGWDIICGSRYMKGGKKVGGPKLQGWLSFFVCSTLHFLTRIPTTDVSNSFKIYKKSILKNVDISDKSGVEASMEITLQAYFNGAKITEVPTTWRGRISGKSKFKIMERMLLYWKIYSWALNNSLRRTLGIPTIQYQ